MRIVLYSLVSLAVFSPTLAQANDLGNRNPHSMHRNVEVVPGGPKALPGHIAFRTQLDLWTGAEVKPGWPSYLSSCHIRVEVYEPKDTTLSLPIFVSESAPIATPTGYGRYENRSTHEHQLGPFPATETPYAVRVLLMKGGTIGPRPGPIGFQKGVSNTFSGTEFKAVVR